MNVKPVVIEVAIKLCRVSSSGRLVQLPNSARAFWLELSKQALLHLVSFSAQLGGQPVEKYA